METFVVRIWAPADTQELHFKTRPVQGRLEHVTSGRGASFRGIEELSRLIQEELHRTRGARVAPKEKEA